jgi:hypothetical protein
MPLVMSPGMPMRSENCFIISRLFSMVPEGSWEGMVHGAAPGIPKPPKPGVIPGAAKGAPMGMEEMAEGSKSPMASIILTMASAMASRVSANAPEIGRAAAFAERSIRAKVLERTAGRVIWG